MPSQTLATYRTRIRAVLGLPSDDESLIDGWLNDGYEDVLLRLKCNVGIATMSLTASQDDYTLPSQIMEILEIWSSADDGRSFRMERSTPEEMLRMRRGVGSGPARYYTVMGARSLLLYPSPGAGESLGIYYIPRPTALSASGDAPSDVPAELHGLLEFYALWRAADYRDDDSSAQGERYRTIYMDEIKRAQASMRRRGGRRLATSRPGGRPTPSHNPSQDI